MESQNYLIVKTKLSRPTFNSQYVQRKNLLAALEKAKERKLALVCAPAGYGKSSLLAQYYELLLDSDHSATWLSLDEHDADFGRFFLYVIQAIKKIDHNFGESLLSILQSGFSNSLEATSINFEEAVSTIEHPIYLFIDDFHLAETPDICAVIKQILLGKNNLRFVISTRNKPNDLAVPRLSMFNEIYEIDQSSLRFSQQESNDFFKHTLDFFLPEKFIKVLNEKTEGWIAGIQLASISLRYSEDQENMVRTFSGEHTKVGEFIGEEILSNLPPDIKEFLIKCSLLNRFNYQLCDHVLESTRSSEFISALKSNHLFTVSLDDIGYWYRFHHLFSQFLRKRLLEEYGDTVQELHDRASVWNESQGHMNDAIEHALASKNDNRAAELLDRVSAELFYQGKISLLENYANSISSEALHYHPGQQLDLIWQWLVIWQFAKAKVALNQTRRTIDECKGNPNFQFDDGELQFLETKYAHREMSFEFFSDNLVDTGELAVGWLENHLNDDLSMISSAKTMLLASERDRFKFEDTLARVQVLHDMTVAANFSYGFIFCNCVCASTLLEQGQMNASEEYFENACKAALELHGEHAALTAMPSLLLAELYYEKNRLTEAKKIIDKYLPLSNNFGLANNITAGFLTKTRMEFVRGEKSTALRTIEDGRRTSLSTGFERLRIAMLTESVRQLILSDEIKTALSLASSAGIGGGARRYLPDEQSTWIDAQKALIWVRISAAMNNSSNAIRVLNLWVNHLKSRDSIRMALKFSLTLADTLFLSGDKNTARQHLNYALEEGIARGFRRIFPDEGPFLEPHIKNIKWHKHNSHLQTATEEIIALYKTSNLPASRSSKSHTPHLIKESNIDLSTREIEILIMAQNDKSNAEIAKVLSLTVGTVKWYWQSIFQKLGVRRRNQAVALASDLGLISSSATH